MHHCLQSGLLYQQNFLLLLSPCCRPPLHCLLLLNHYLQNPHLYSLLLQLCHLPLHCLLQRNQYLQNLHLYLLLPCCQALPWHQHCLRQLLSWYSLPSLYHLCHHNQPLNQPPERLPLPVIKLFSSFFYSLYFSGITSFTWSMFEINILPNVPESFFKHALVVLSTIIA